MERLSHLIAELRNSLSEAAPMEEAESDCPCGGHSQEECQCAQEAHEAKDDDDEEEDDDDKESAEESMGSRLKKMVAKVAPVVKKAKSGVEAGISHGAAALMSVEDEEEPQDESVEEMDENDFSMQDWLAVEALYRENDEDLTEKKARLGSGARFKSLSKKLRHKGATNPKALAAWIGRQKLGKGKFQKLAAKGK